MRHHRLPSSARAVTVAFLALAVASVALLGWLLWSVANLAGDLDSADRRLDAARAARADLAKGLNEANQRLRDAGEEPVRVPTPGPAGPPGEPGAQGPPGEPGPEGPPPSDAAVRQAVAAYCADTGSCQGSDGQDVTRSQVRAAVATYCDDQGQCRGPAGGPGEPGPQGPQGPGPTDEQVARAVDAYCAAGRCRGEPGPPGPQGPRGEPGTARPGSYQCPEDQYVHGVNIAADGTVTLACRAPGLVTLP